jgi:hypothetical protein
LAGPTNQSFPARHVFESDLAPDNPESGISCGKHRHLNTTQQSARLTQGVDHPTKRTSGTIIPSAPLFFANADTSLRLVAKNCAALPERTAIVVSLEQSDDLDSSASLSNRVSDDQEASLFALLRACRKDGDADKHSHFREDACGKVPAGSLNSFLEGRAPSLR